MGVVSGVDSGKAGAGRASGGDGIKSPRGGNPGQSVDRATRVATVDRRRIHSLSSQKKARRREEEKRGEGGLVIRT